MKFKKKIANIKNWLNVVRKKQYIVIHYSSGSIDTDENNGEYFGREVTYTSANYFVDDDSYTVSVPPDKVAYHCGKDYSGGKAPYWGKCTNYNSIGIEMCGIANDKILDMRNPTIKNTVELTRKLMKKYMISARHVVRHYDVCGKNCPAPFVKHQLAWEAFKLNILGGFKVKTTKAGVKLRNKLGSGTILKTFKKGKKIKIAQVYYDNGKLYGKTNKGNFILLKNTNYKKKIS